MKRWYYRLCSTRTHTMQQIRNFLLQPTTLMASLIFNALVVVNYTSVVVPLLIANISSAPVTIEKGEMLAVDQCLEQHSFSKQPAERHGNKTTPVQKACDRAALRLLGSKSKHCSRYSTHTAMLSRKISGAQILFITQSTSATVVKCVKA